MAKGKYEYWLTDDGLLLLTAWARDGLIDEQIAKNMGVSRTTLNTYKNTFPAILNALKKGKEVVDIEVENSLYKRAMGYVYDEVKEEYESVRRELDDGSVVDVPVLVKRTVTKKEIVGDTTAQIFWLKNRKPAAWRDKPAGEENEFAKALENVDNVLISIRKTAAEAVEGPNED